MPTASERPTVPPSFDALDPERDSEVHVRAARPHPQSPADELPASETRIAARPKLNNALTDEAWARQTTGEPVVAISNALLRSLPLDHRAGFLLSLMDGTMDLETVVDLSAMPREDALQIARCLHELGIITFR
jgi:hypothetical protein